MKSGGTIPIGDLFHLAKAETEREHVKYKGFVVDGIPINPKGVTISDQFDYLESLLLKQKPHNFVLIDLRISDDDLMRRNASVWIDPINNNAYPGQQVLYSRQRRKEGWVDGDIDPLYEAERGSHQLVSQREDIAEEGEDEKEAEDEEQDEGESEEVKKEEKAPLMPKSRKTYNILSEKILDRYLSYLTAD